MTEPKLISYLNLLWVFIICIVIWVLEIFVPVCEEISQMHYDDIYGSLRARGSADPDLMSSCAFFLDALSA
jgi:hypothetical protein